MEFSEILSELIKNQPLKNAELERRIGIPNGTIGKYLNGSYDPSAKSLIAIANYFNVSVDRLLGREGQVQPESELDYYNYWKTIFGSIGMNTIKRSLAVLIQKYGCDDLAKVLDVDFTDIKNFISLSNGYDYKIWERFDKLLLALDTNVTNLLLTPSQSSPVAQADIVEDISAEFKKASVTSSK